MTRSFARTLTKQAIGTTLAAALALTTATTAPARAGDEELGAIAAASFFALVAAGIIASAQNDNARRGSTSHHGTYHPQRPRIDPKKALPSECRVTVRGGPDRGTWYQTRCLKRNFTYAARLPARCENLVYVPRLSGNIRAYDDQCLAGYGYREAGQRQSTRR